MERTPTLITSVRRALHLMEAVSAHAGGVTAKRLARETELPLGTTYHLLRTLVHDGYLRKLDDGGFVLGDAVDSLQDRAVPQAQLSRLRPALAALRDELNMATYFARYEDGEIRILTVVDSPQARRVQGAADIGGSGGASALGKCVLRQLDENARKDYFARHPPRRFTPYTVTGVGELHRRLEDSPPRWLSWDEQEYELGTGCAAVPVTDGDSVGALAVSYPVDRRGQVEASANRLASAARLVSYTLAG